MAVFDSVEQVALFLGLTIMIWCDWYAPTVSMWSDFQLFKLWHKATRPHLRLPPPLFFPVFIVTMYVLWEYALYAFYLNVFPAGSAPWICDTVTFCFVFCLAFLKQWIAVYMVGGRQIMALVLLALAGATGGAVMGAMGSGGHWVEFGCFGAPFVLFWLGALYLNVRTYWLDQRKDCAPITVDMRQVQKKVAVYDIK